MIDLISNTFLIKIKGKSFNFKIKTFKSSPELKPAVSIRLDSFLFTHMHFEDSYRLQNLAVDLAYFNEENHKILQIHNAKESFQQPLRRSTEQRADQHNSQV